MEENLSIERDEIKLDSTFQSLGIDSLDTFQLIIEIEEEFGIEVESPENMKTKKLPILLIPINVIITPLIIGIINPGIKATIFFQKYITSKPILV